MQLFEHKAPKAEAFRGFVEGVHNLQAYLRSNSGDRLSAAEDFFNQSLTADPDFAPAQYYQAIVLTHARKPDSAIRLLEPLSQREEGYRAEVLYNLAFAYAKKYKYEFFNRAIEILDEAYRNAEQQKRSDLVLLVQALQAWTFAVFAGRDYKHPDDFQKRQQALLPGAINKATSVLGDRRLQQLSSETRVAIEVECHNAMGIAYMRMGQYSIRFERSSSEYWELAESHFGSALEKHPRDVRVLDNISTLKLIQGCDSIIEKQIDPAHGFFEAARQTAELSISYNRHDRFRHYNRSRACALLGQWEVAMVAANEILNEPGEVSEQQVQDLKYAIVNRDSSTIVDLLRSYKHS